MKKKRNVLKYCILIVGMFFGASESNAQIDELLQAPSYTVVRIYLKETDSTVVAKPLKFEADIANPGWIQFLDHFRKYFFQGEKQPLSRYQVQAVVDGISFNCLSK